MPNSIDFYKMIFLLVISVRIIVPWLKLSFILPVFKMSFEQNVVEDTDEINNKVFRKNHQNNYKRQYRLNCIVF